MLIKSMLNRSPSDLAREMDRLFDSMAAATTFPVAASMGHSWAYPALNLWEDDDHLLAEAELPGLSMDDIEVLVTSEELVIKGARSASAPEGAQPLRRERSAGSFERTVSLPAPIDAEKVEAHLRDGVLSITLPKAEAHRPRRIQVRTTGDAS